MYLQTQVFSDEVQFIKSTNKYEESWEIDGKIYGHKDVDGKRFYRVKFKNISGHYWIDEDNPGCLQTIRNYEHVLSMTEAIETVGGYESHQKTNVNKILQKMKKRDPMFSIKRQFPAYDKKAENEIEQPATLILEENEEKLLVPSESLTSYRERQNKRRNRLKKLKKKQLNGNTNDNLAE